MQHTINSLIQETRKNIDIIDIYVLLMFVLQVDKNFLLINGKIDISEHSTSKFFELCKRRAKGEPTQYIINSCEFMSLNFYIDNNVLIPRPDTEILVETILENESNGAEKLGLEIGSGSGCISISLSYYGNYFMHGIDISQKAIDIANKNADSILETNNSCKFYQSDLFKNIKPDSFDFVVSNPPYIPTNDIEQLSINVKNFEPICALDGGKDGLGFYRKICRQAKYFLKPNGNIYFEIGYNQADDVALLLKTNGYTNIKIIKDLAGLDRVVKAVSL